MKLLAKILKNETGAMGWALLWAIGNDVNFNLF